MVINSFHYTKLCICFSIKCLITVTALTCPFPFSNFILVESETRFGLYVIRETRGGVIFCPYCFLGGPSLRRPGIPHASGAMPQQRSAGKPHKRRPTAIDVERSIRCSHGTPKTTEKRETNTFSQRGLNWAASCECPQKTERRSFWTLNHPRRAQPTRPPPLVPGAREGRGGEAGREVCRQGRRRTALCAAGPLPPGGPAFI